MLKLLPVFVRRSSPTPLWGGQLALLSTAAEFDKILIANRGEIACRIMRTAKRLGLKTVAVYSEPDKNALHVQQADEAVCIGPAPALQSYLNVDNVLDAIRKTGAQAVHPGYGFLSENEKFVQLLEQEGINFIGPPASAIHDLGDKVTSKVIAKEANLNIIPGWVGAVQDEQQALQVAADMGYPVMIKASAGGGGKGMRIVRHETELLDSLAMAKAEALSSFGSDVVLIEKYIEDARHIEFQVLGDKHGSVVYLPERDCSVQRRNQKVIEESPSPLLSPEVRRAMGEQAVALAKAVGYYSTGTVEFVVDSRQQFYFLEMNTRLQVEHPVTEMVTGLDLVEQMIRVARGERLQMDQRQAAQIRCWAMESRVYAENPARNFAPSPGRLRRYIEPRGPNVRVDSGIREGDEISVYYDPMISKLITHGPTRQDAMRSMAQALDRYVIEGVTNNLLFLRSILNQPAFNADKANYDTSFITKYYAGLNGLKSEAFPLSRDSRREMLAIAAYLHAAEQRRLGAPAVPEQRLVVSEHDVHLEEWRDEPAAVRPARADMVGAAGAAAGAMEVEVAGGVLQVQPDAAAAAAVGSYSPHLHLLLIDGRPVAAQTGRQTLRGRTLQYQGGERQLRVQPAAVAALERYMPDVPEWEHHRLICAPMAGTLVEVNVKHGDKVEVGDELAVVEAMKMRLAICAEHEGIVEEVYGRAGEVVQADQQLVKLW